MTQGPFVTPRVVQATRQQLGPAISLFPFWNRCPNHLAATRLGIRYTLPDIPCRLEVKHPWFTW